jgi:hypothetical protein
MHVSINLQKVFKMYILNSLYTNSVDALQLRYDNEVM